ncbi:MAG TPA: radical SAM/SPASM domain-containing protein [Thermoanaerobaculia bacterium]|jgi:pyruvate-formate lyase-activating enzyme|nr:radical SAM/SPASM domain-containing protein [Thermoanaerobaculia bacterium]
MSVSLESPSRTALAPSAFVAGSFLHVGRDRVYNPLSDRMLREGDAGYAELREVLAGAAAEALPAVTLAGLLADGWLQEAAEDASRRFRLKYVSLEAHTVCNQACYFCPVSVAPREAHFMPMELYRGILGQLGAWRDTIEAVFMINYNEPTADKRFVEQVAAIRAAGLPPAVLTNATGLTPRRVDELLALGGLRFLSINLSTVDRARYSETRGGDHLELVLKNLDYVADKPLAEKMDVIVLGTGDEAHQRDFAAIHARFAGTRFDVSKHRVMDRAGLMQIGARPPRPHARLCGCENVGSRPLQHLHITPHGKCLLCCEDYDEQHVVGDLNVSTVAEVLAGPEIARLRRWVYGLEEAPADFMCRKCIFARTR